MTKKIQKSLMFGRARLDLKKEDAGSGGCGFSVHRPYRSERCLTEGQKEQTLLAEENF